MPREVEFDCIITDVKELRCISTVSMQCYKGTCNFLKRSPCVLFPCFPCFAFQNCLCAEYLFIGHTLKRQSRQQKEKQFY